ncbi:MAG: hypothetical protein MR482_05265 [Selenomonadales bacterium]|nr:hypothetical protein [Selenomonadales bacterium]
MAISSNLSPIEKALNNTLLESICQEPLDSESLLLVNHYEDIQYVLTDSHEEFNRYHIFDNHDLCGYDNDINVAFCKLLRANGRFSDDMLVNKNKLQQRGLEKDFLNICDNKNEISKPYAKALQYMATLKCCLKSNIELMPKEQSKWYYKVSSIGAYSYVANLCFIMLPDAIRRQINLPRVVDDDYLFNNAYSYRKEIQHQLDKIDKLNYSNENIEEANQRYEAMMTTTKNGKSARNIFYYLLKNAYQNNYIEDYTIEAAKNAKKFLKWSDSSIKAAITKFAPEAAFDRPGFRYADKVFDIINAADKLASVTR